MSEWKEKIFGEVATVTKGKLTLQSESKEQDYLTLINADVVNGKNLCSAIQKVQFYVTCPMY